MWQKQSGIYPCIAFTDIVCGYQLPAAEGSDSCMRTLREMVSAFVGWDNDLTSYDKEAHRVAERGYPATPNLVSVLAVNLECSVADAVAVAGAMRDRAMLRFLRLRDQIAADGSATLTRHVDGLAQWSCGHMDYTGQCPRYTDRAPGTTPS